MGALKLLSGGSASLAAVDDLHQATGRDLNLVVGREHSSTVGGDMQERVEGMRVSVAGVSQLLIAPKTWLGSEEVNVLHLICELLDLVRDMNYQMAQHNHGPAAAPTNSENFMKYAGLAIGLTESLKPISY